MSDGFFFTPQSQETNSPLFPNKSQPLIPCLRFPGFPVQWHRAWGALIPPPKLCRKALAHTWPAGNWDSPSSRVNGSWALGVEGHCSLQRWRRGFAAAGRALQPGNGELQRAKGQPEQVLPADSLNPATPGFIRERLPEQEPAG